MATDLLDRPALRRLWDAIAERLQRNGRRPAGTIVLGGLERDERHAIAGLLGKPVPGERVTIELSRLDQRIRSSGAASGLLAAVESRCGPVVDRRGERQALLEAREGVWRAGRDAIDTAGLSADEFVEPWLDGVRRAGVLGRLPGERAAAMLVAAVACIRQLPLHTLGQPMARGDLASAVAADAHGLDDGTVLAALVLRAVALMAGRPYPSTPSGRRDLWLAAGVVSDEVSTTVLTIGLRSQHGDTWLDDRSDARWETHLTTRDLRRIELGPPAGDVFVCENPRVLEAAVDRGSACAGVCTMGQPAIVVLTLIRSLVALGATLRYHGDFDWPGVSIANAMIGTHGCVPWRMTAADYEAALAHLAPMIGDLPPLDGRPVDALWDPALTVAMRRSRRTIHEELVIGSLLGDIG